MISQKTSSTIPAPFGIVRLAVLEKEMAEILVARKNLIELDPSMESIFDSKKFPSLSTILSVVKLSPKVLYLLGKLYSMDDPSQ